MTRRLGMLGMMGLLLAGCGAEPGEPAQVATFEVSPRKVPCYGMRPWLCLEVKDAGASQYVRLHEGIQGFQFRWGVTQTLKVRVEDVPNPPEDSPSHKLILEETLAATPVPEGTTFELSMANEHLTGSAAEGFSLVYTEALACATEDVCTALAQRRSGPPLDPLTLVVRPPDVAGEPLRVESVR